MTTNFWQVWTWEIKREEAIKKFWIVKIHPTWQKVNFTKKKQIDKEKQNDKKIDK